MSFYSRIRSRLSKQNKGRLSKFLIHAGLKPKVNRKISSAFKEGVVVFSVDFEMAWAFRYSKTKANVAVETGLIERINVPLLLDLFDKYGLPVTWATVGHLFLKQCRRNGLSIAHPEMPRPSYFENRNWTFNSGDWYDHDPCSDYKTDSAWYATDLIEQILGSKTKHEIGCHSFSHIDFTYANCPLKLAAAELDACLKLACEKGVQLKSFIFPGGTAGNYEMLKEKGFICYRKPMKHHIDMPYVDNYGLVAIPSSLGLEKDSYGWSIDFHLMLLNRFLNKVIKTRQVCHFWLHPSLSPWYLQNVLPALLELIASHRDKNNIQVLTMSQIAETILHND